MNPIIDQQNTLFKLVHDARHTEFGRRHYFDEIRTYEDFKQRVPIHFYDDLAEYISRMKEGAPDVLWPGVADSFAVSAGTTGSGKHLPLSHDRLRSDRSFMRRVVASYLMQRPNIFSLLGSHISLPGSVEQINGLRMGEISGFTAQQAPVWLKPFQLIDPELLTTLTFKQKFDRVIEQALDADVTIITAVPSWILTLFQEALRRTEKNSIADLWPNLKLLICGGVKLANYRPHLQQLAGPLNLDFIETYGASEGYFSYSDDLNRDDMRLVTGNGIFYEFIPNPLPDEQSLGIQQAVQLSEVETGVPYGMLVSTNAGLWRYAVRDIVEFTSLKPHRIVVRGRISEMLDDYGEGLYVYEAEAAIRETAGQLNLETGAFTITSRLDSEKDVPRHHWYVQFVEPVHRDTLRRLAAKVDEYLRKVNRHYAIRRESEALGMPRFESITQTQINNWLESHGKDKAQGKLPRVLPQGSKII